MSGHRRLRRSIAAIDSGWGKPLVVQLQSGGLVRVVGPARDSGLVDVIHEGRLLSVFNADLIERSEPVLAAAS